MKTPEGEADSVASVPPRPNAGGTRDQRRVPKLAPWCRHDKDGKENRADENEHAFGSVTSVERQVRFQLQTVSVCMSVLSFRTPHRCSFGGGGGLQPGVAFCWKQ